MIVWLTGATSAGKTWLGDFLQHHHNFLHVDGDQRMILHYGNCEMTDGVVKAFYGYWFDNKEAPSELWHPYYNELCDKITDHYKADPEKSIVLSFSTYPRAVRDYVREEVKRRTGQDLIMVLLSMSLDDYARRQKDKFTEWAKANNQTPEEVWNGVDILSAQGEYSEEKLNAHYQKAREFQGLEPIQSDEENSYTVDTDHFHGNVVTEITKFLNLPKVLTVDNDVIKKITTDRLEDYGKMKKNMKEEKESEEKTRARNE